MHSKTTARLGRWKCYRQIAAASTSDRSDEDSNAKEMFPVCVCECVRACLCVHSVFERRSLESSTLFRITRRLVCVRFAINCVDVGICCSVLVFPALKAIYVDLLSDTVQMHVYADHS